MNTFVQYILLDPPTLVAVGVGVAVEVGVDVGVGVVVCVGASPTCYLAPSAVTVIQVAWPLATVER